MKIKYQFRQIILLLFVLASGCLPQPEPTTNLNPIQGDIVNLLKNHFDSLQILEKNYHFRVHKDLEVFPDWKEAVIYSNHRLIVIPAKRKASATYGHGYLRRFVFELDEVGKVMKGGILELSGLDTRILIENEKDLIAGYLHGKKNFSSNLSLV